MESKYIILKDLPKISLNKWYAGTHWSNRKDIKDAYKLLIKSQTKEFFKKDSYHVSYTFYFKSNPLDASNCVAMVKLIEDCLFESDSYKHIDIGYIKSRKSEFNFVEIIIDVL